MRNPTEKAKDAISRFQRRREQTARELIEAARRVLAFKGYHDTKIVDIARAANVGVGTFYLYYPTKQAIFFELVDDAVQRLRTQLAAQRASTEDPATQARHGTETFFRFAQDNRELFRIVFGHGAAFHDVVRKAQEMFVQDAVANITAGMELGVFRRSRPDVIAQAFIGMSLQVVSWWLEQTEVPIEEVSASLTDLAFHGMMADATPPPGTD